MLIGVSVRLLIKNRIDGIARFTYESLKRITTNHPEHQFVFFFDRSFDPEFIFNSNITPVVVPPQTRRPVLNNIWTDYTLPFAMRKYKLDAFVSMDGMLPLSATMPCLTVIHDLNYEHHPDWIPAYSLKYYKTRFPKFAAKAKRIATVSEYSKQDISQTYHINPNNIDVVYNGVADKFKALSTGEIATIRNQYSGGLPYFLFVGSVHPRKNMSNTLLAFDDYCERSKQPKALIIAGEKYAGNGEMEKIFEEMRHKDKVYFTGKVTDDVLVKLYGAAHTFLYASLFEGFGIPLLEAMKSHVPVITSNLTALPEICNEAAILVNPYSYQQISQAMLDADHVEIREKLINLGIERAAYFTWERTANLLWNSIEKTISNDN